MTGGATDAGGTGAGIEAVTCLADDADDADGTDDARAAVETGDRPPEPGSTRERSATKPASAV